MQREKAHRKRSECKTPSSGVDGPLQRDLFSGESIEQHEGALSVPLRRKAIRRAKRHRGSGVDPLKHSNCGLVFADHVKTIKVMVEGDAPVVLWLTLGKGSSDTVSVVEQVLYSRLRFVTCIPIFVLTDRKGTLSPSEL
jgi:hypothetical protein